MDSTIGITTGLYFFLSENYDTIGILIFFHYTITPTLHYSIDKIG